MQGVNWVSSEDAMSHKVKTGKIKIKIEWILKVSETEQVKRRLGQLLNLYVVKCAKFEPDRTSKLASALTLWKGASRSHLALTHAEGKLHTSWLQFSNFHPPTTVRKGIWLTHGCLRISFAGLCTKAGFGYWRRSVLATHSIHQNTLDPQVEQTPVIYHAEVLNKWVISFI